MARVSQRYGCEKSLFGGDELLFFIVKQQISKSDMKSAESVTTVR
jgi:hypothetical protein